MGAFGEELDRHFGGSIHDVRTWGTPRKRPLVTKPKPNEFGWYQISNDKHILDEYDTYPPEGIDVLVSDGTHTDVANYLRSSEYKWTKVNVKDDELNDFTNFIPIEWKFIK